MFWVSRKNRLPLTIALIVGLVVLGTIVTHAHGPKPSPGARYTGTVYVVTPAGKTTARQPVAFGINSADDRAQNFRLPAISHCHLSAHVVSASTPILTPTHFLTHLAIVQNATQIGTLTINGVFHTLGRLSGAINTTFSTASGLSQCDAAGGYTAKS